MAQRLTLGNSRSAATLGSLPVFADNSRHSRPARPFPQPEKNPVHRILLVFMLLALAACGKDPAPAAAPPEQQPFEVSVDRFADVEVLRYEVPGFDELPLREKKLAYYLSQAALAGRDIIYDQNYEHNLRIRKLLSAVIGTYSGDRDGDDFRKLVEYAKRVWFAHGIHHHYSTGQDAAGVFRRSTGRNGREERRIEVAARRRPVARRTSRHAAPDHVRPGRGSEASDAGPRSRPGREFRGELLRRRHRHGSRAVLCLQGRRGSRSGRCRGA